MSRLILYYEKVQQVLNDNDDRLKRVKSTPTPLKRNYKRRIHSVATFDSVKQFEGQRTQSSWQLPLNTPLSSGTYNSSLSRGTNNSLVSKGTDNISVTKGTHSERYDNSSVSGGTDKSPVTRGNGTQNSSVSTGKDQCSVFNDRSSQKIDNQKFCQHLILKRKSGSGFDNETDIVPDTEEDRSKDWSSQPVVYPGQEDSITLSEVQSATAVSCVSQTEKKEGGEDVRVPISGGGGGGRMSQASPPVSGPRTREMNRELPLNLMELNITRTEECEDSSSQREIVLVDNKPQAEMTGETLQQNKDQEDGDVNQDGGSGRGCEGDGGRENRITSASCHASPLKLTPFMAVDKELLVKR